LGSKRPLPNWLSLSLLLLVLVVPLARWASVAAGGTPARAGHERQLTQDQSAPATVDADGDGLPDIALAPALVLPLLAIVYITRLVENRRRPLGRHLMPTRLPPR